MTAAFSIRAASSADLWAAKDYFIGCITAENAIQPYERPVLSVEETIKKNQEWVFWRESVRKIDAEIKERLTNII